MSRVRKSADSSLELLLDTICNTFGGIVFIAILLVVMLQMTSRANSAATKEAVADQAALEALQRREAEVRADLDTLRLATQQQTEQTAQYADPELATKLAKLEQQRAELEKGLQERMQRLGKIAAAQSQINEIQAEIARLDGELRAAQDRVRDAQAKLDQERATHTENAEMSRQQYSTNRHVALIVRHGRMYVWHKYDSEGNRVGPNLDEFAIIAEDDKNIEVQPLPFAGMQLDAAPELPDRLQRRLGSFTPDQFLLDIALWPDSFEQFKYLKAAAIKLGYRYRLYPATPGVPVIDQGSNDSRVQ